MELDSDKIIYFSAIFIFLALFLWIHLIPFLISLRIIKYLKDKNKKYSPYILLAIVSLVPTLFFLYLIYFAFTCGDTCFSWLFLSMSLLPVLIFSIINQNIRKNIHRDHSMQSLKDNLLLKEEQAKKNKERLKKELEKIKKERKEKYAKEVEDFMRARKEKYGK
ncbi:MAG: hypothetical protein OQK48_00840 [Sulfurimonas sp.]|uniref:hypothetical protein n=1 Tax=Sulfurimonas sp. TaxID=2022749 RepID=UPI00261D947A|nr:hypothetical protein [Sulfurimonas sp.]MCW8894425.1 hypothetical protein [Sulfurimonas sp.]MCW8953470.1 hypothetical protein [Sulfurimonas sp.]MCW9067725.1 hypothetical protein [Sulfurimonas sp.]